jgi:predicted Rossmann fold flavoprotein
VTPESDMRWDVVVVGAGAAGVLAAARAAERGRRTLLLEKNRKPGVKILMSGGTRCNITQATDARGIVEAFGSKGRFLHSALAALSPADLVALIEAEGVLTKVEATGKIFPRSDKAADVCRALLRRLGRSGCQLALGEPLLDLARSGRGFELSTSQRILSAGKVIVTTGGQSYPACGTTGDGYRWLAALGHTIVPPRPALTPVTTTAAWVADLRGVTIPDVAVCVTADRGEASHADLSTAHAGKPTKLAEARGSFLFTHFGLSGPAVLNVSRAITCYQDPRLLQLQCDFLPSLRPDMLDEHLRRLCTAQGKRGVAGLLTAWLPRRLAESIVDRLGLASLRAAEVSKNDRRLITNAIKQTRIAISGTCGFEKAEVTAGGTALEEVDSRTMQSSIVPNLFLAGEVLDLDGPIGGYNFQAAFSEAWLAGDHV